MRKIKDFINGFRKLSYTVELAKKPSQFKLPMETINDAARLAATIPTVNMKFHLLEVNIKKRSLLYINDVYGIISSPMENQFVKISKTKYGKDLYQTEYVVDCTKIVNFLDGKIWEINIKVLITCGTFNDIYDLHIANVAMDIANGIIKSLELENIVENPAVLPFYHLTWMNNVSKKYTEGVVMVYSNGCNPFYGNMNKVIPDYNRNDAHILFDGIYSSYPEDELQDEDDGTIKVIRKRMD